MSFIIITIILTNIRGTVGKRKKNILNSNFDKWTVIETSHNSPNGVNHIKHL
jgi:hypothetical protein